MLSHAFAFVQSPVMLSVMWKMWLYDFFSCERFVMFMIKLPEVYVTTKGPYTWRHFHAMSTLLQKKVSVNKVHSLAQNMKRTSMNA